MTKLCKLFSLLLCACLILSSCSTKLLSPNRFTPEKIPVLQEYDYIKFSLKQLVNEIKSLNRILSEKNISESKYKDILNRLEVLGKQVKIFNAIKINKNEGSFIIPANSKTTFYFKSYCLNPHGASPASKEQFIFTKAPPDIPLYKDVMIYSNSAVKNNTVNKQLLLWNLKNNVKFENLPTNQQAFLLKMDPMSYLKINNYITSELKASATKFAKTQIPFYNQVTDTIKLVKGKAYTYEEYKRNIENIAVKAKLIDNTAPIKTDGYDGVFTQTESSAFSGTTIIFINANSFPITIACTSFLDPLRKGVQPIGFDMPTICEEYDKYEDEFLNELDKLLLNLYKIAVTMTGKDNWGDYQSVQNSINNNKADIFFFLVDGLLAWEHTKARFGKNSEDGENHAFRHALWSALMTRDMGVKKAEEFASNHELPIYQTRGRTMDLHNNKIGREIAVELMQTGDLSVGVIINSIIINKDKLKIDKPTGKWQK